jgi:hypothetical protein
MMRKQCKHLLAFIRGTDLIGYAYCPTCDGLVSIAKILNNWLDEFRRMKDKYDAQRDPQ